MSGTFPEAVPARLRLCFFVYDSAYVFLGVRAHSCVRVCVCALVCV